MKRGTIAAVVVTVVAAAAVTLRGGVSARADLPPWTDADDVPLAPSSRSIAPRRGDLVIVDAPNRAAARRGLSATEVRLPLYGAKRGTGCASRWFLVGPLAWVCGDFADPSPDESDAFVTYASRDPSGLLFPYYFVGRDGASAYARPGGEDLAPTRELEPGWAVGVVEERAVGGDRWGRTPHGEWFSLREIFPGHPSLFRGEEVKDGALDFAWVLADGGKHVRFERIGWHEQRAGRVRVSPDGSPPEWMAARELAHPALSPQPAELAPGERRWIDVDLATQTLVAYDGTRPVYATLVSTGRGARGSGNDTPPGVHRIWVKILYSTMDNVERDDIDKHYSMEDVPYVQFFDKAVGLHGTYWHRDFGHVKSHGCVNLAPLDARWLFGWTSPSLPAGWQAAYPTALEPGTLIRVRSASGN